MPFAPRLLHKPVSAGFCKYFAVWLWKSLESNMYIEGKMAIITGSTSGIGLGIARSLANQGANIVLNSFTNLESDHNLAENLAKEFSVKVSYACADMKNPQECRDLIASQSACDILVNNAGIQYVAPIEDFPTSKWDEIIAVNLTSSFHTTATALKMMRENNWGRVINISSAHGLTASPFKSAYIAAKHGLIGLTKTTALETAEQKITANAICPGYVLTPLVEQQIPDTMAEYNMSREEVVRLVMLARQPSREFASSDQIGETCAFLCSDAAAQITGTSISIDGGWTAL